MMKLLVPLLIFTVNVLNVAGIYECCPGENLLYQNTRGCSPNNPNTTLALACNSLRIRLSNVSQFGSFGYTFLNNETILEEKTGKEIKYCHSDIVDETNNTNPIYILCVEKSSAESIDDERYRVQPILLCISTVFVFLTIIIYFMVPSLLDLQGICIMHTLFGLAFGYIFLSIIQLNQNFSDVACTMFAYLTYFCCMYLFFWLVVLSFHIWRTTVKPKLAKHVKWAIVYHTIGIGAPLCALFIVLTAHYSTSEFWDDIRPGIGETKCWFGTSREVWIYFYGPIIFLLSMLLFFYLWTIVSLWGRVESSRNKILKYRLKLCARLCIIMGITWIIEIFTFVMNEHVDLTIAGKILMFLLDLFNILQGVSIFLVLVVFRKRVRRALASKNICNIKFPNSWRHLEDEELESVEEKTNGVRVEYLKDIIDDNVHLEGLSSQHSQHAH